MCARSAGDPLGLVAPPARQLQGRLDRLGAGVHRQDRVHAGQARDVGGEGGEAVVVEGPGGERHPVELRVGGRDQRGVPVTEVERRVAGEGVEVAPALDVGDPRPFGLGDDHR
jgi:hypothetical protein